MGDLTSERIETGARFCGVIAAAMRGDPFWLRHDHDDDCRRTTGGAINLWVGYRRDRFRLIRGVSRTFSKARGIVRTFCSECGTSIGYHDEGLGDDLYLAIGFLDRPERFRPQAHAYWRTRLPWIEQADDLPLVDGHSQERDPSVGNPKSC